LAHASDSIEKRERRQRADWIRKFNISALNEHQRHAVRSARSHEAFGADAVAACCSLLGRAAAPETLR
jgi:hypothetical protein